MEFLLSDYFTAVLIFFGAILYSSVGHGGASSYIAIMSLMETPIGSIKPIGLVLNIIVSSISSYHFIKHKLFNLKVFLPVVLGSVPASFIGGYIELSPEIYKPLVGVVLLLSGFHLLFNLFANFRIKKTKNVNLLLGLSAGAIIGFLSGLTGTGGGIFLSPLIVLLGWTTVKGASGTAALFILFNSISGLMGNITSVNLIPNTIYLYVVAVLIGVMVGNHLGVRVLSESGVKKTLGIVIIIAGFKFILT